MSVKEKKILLGISGGIAAYKSILLLRLLKKEGAEVQVVMTPAAKQFVSPLVLSTLSNRPVVCELSEGDTWANHVHLGRWADAMVVAPATCNTIAKMASGICDNLLQAVYLSATCPILIAPAMDEDMWQHGTTKANLEKLRSFGYKVLPVGKGELASGLVGEGRLLEPEEILSYIKAAFEPAAKPLNERKALVTAGPTFEAIDPVRFIGNHSSGLMGIEIANALAEAGADTTLLLGPTHLTANKQVKTIKVTSADEMYAAAVANFAHMDMAVMAAAVADFKPANAAPQKIKKGSKQPLPIELVQNPDILAHCGEHKTPQQLVVGFALETNNEADNARQKLERKKADIIVLNSLNDQEAGFGTSTNKVTIFESNGAATEWPLQSKKDLAIALTKLMIKKLHEKHP